jgi:hypothetical protein
MSTEAEVFKRLMAFNENPPENPTALLALKAARPHPAIEQRLEPIVIRMDKYGSHGVSVSQLLRMAYSTNA